MLWQSSALTHRTGLGAALFLSLSACPNEELAPLNPCTVSGVRERIDQAGLSKVDLLFVIDNSGSMATEQLKLAQELPRLVRVLTTGDRYAGEQPPPGADGGRFTPVSSLHLGVVSTNMGGLDEDPLDGNLGVMACRGLGDDGKLLRSTEVAVEGVVATEEDMFQGYLPGDEVLPPEPECEDIDEPPKYQKYQAGEEPDADAVAQAFSCVSRLGVRGCSFEQQLEAMWKAVAPSDGDSDFLDGTEGHGDPDGFNRGFVREDAIFAVIHVSDEEDCSIKPEGKLLFSDSPEANERFGEQIHLRCGRFGESEELVWPAQRYIDGLKSLKPNHTDRIIFAAIVGIPQDAIGDDFDRILARPDMQFRPGFVLPTPSCTNLNGLQLEEAYPPRRFIEVAKGFGDQAVVFSICADDYRPALDTLIGKIAAKLSGNCLPRKLYPDANGLVECDVYELLAPNEEECDPERGHIGEPVRRATEEGEEPRLACQMQQVPVLGGRPMPGGQGWYYDDFSESLRTQCNEGAQQRIMFTFGDLSRGAGATFECLQSAIHIDPDAEGVDAVNTFCTSERECRRRSDDTYTLFCTEQTCQIGCEDRSTCPPGWACGPSSRDPTGPSYCQVPTCPVN